MGIQSPREKDTALLLSRHLTEEDILRLAFGLYALYRAVNSVRFADASQVPTDFPRLLRMFAKEAVNQSNARHLLRP